MSSRSQPRWSSLRPGTICFRFSSTGQYSLNGRWRSNSTNTAVERLRQNLVSYQKTDNYDLTYFYALADEAYGTVGKNVGGSAAIETAVGLAERSGEHFWCAELYRLQGELRQALSESEAESCYQAALEVARQQQAKILELPASVSLGRLWRSQGKHAEAQRLVAGVYAWFSEGFETPNLRDSHAFLAQLA